MKISDKSGLLQPPTAHEKKDPRVMAAAQMYEQQFLREMVKAMRRSVPESDLVPINMGERIHREQLDDQYVQQWSDRGGVGFADIVYEHVMSRFVRPQRIEKPVGPIPMEKIKPMKPMGTQQGLPPTGKLHFEITPSANGRELVSPWPGKVVSQQKMNSGLNHLMVQHDSGLRSEFIFDGVTNLNINQDVSAGQRLARVSPDTQRMFWIVSSRDILKENV